MTWPAWLSCSGGQRNPVSVETSQIPVGRTIADLSRSDSIQPKHMSEAIQYRSWDRNLWESQR